MERLKKLTHLRHDLNSCAYLMRHLEQANGMTVEDVDELINCENLDDAYDVLETVTIPVKRPDRGSTLDYIK